MAAYLAARRAADGLPGRDSVKALRELCRRANEDICFFAEKNGISSTGSTAALLAFAPGEIALCNIGDSRIFRCSGGVLEQISRDHLSPAPFGTKAPLSQNLGIPPEELVIEPYLARGTYTDRDLYLICSDGLTDMVDNDTICRLLTGLEPERAALALRDRALENGGRDNVTLIVCRVEREPGWMEKLLTGQA